MTQDEMYAAFLSEVLPKINSWDDAYKFFGSLVEDTREFGNLMALVNAMFTMYAFLLAMKEKPDEGDIKKLISHMFHIIVYEGQEKLGATFRMLSDEERRALEAGAIASAAAEGLKNSLLAQWDSEKPKGPLH